MSVLAPRAMNEKAPSGVEQNRKQRSWIRVVEWASLIGGVIAVLGFVGFPTLQSLIPHVSFSFNPRSWIEALHAPPPRQPLQATSQLTGQSWTFVLEAHEIRLDFNENEAVRFSDPMFGDGGHWTTIGKSIGAGVVVRIETPQRIVFATQDATGDKMTAMIYRREGQRAVLDATVLMTRVR
jgi:hypothetical protein